jgi:hypothetical protein
VVDGFMHGDILDRARDLSQLYQDFTASAHAALRLDGAGTCAGSTPGAVARRSRQRLDGVDWGRVCGPERRIRTFGCSASCGRVVASAYGSRGASLQPRDVAASVLACALSVKDRLLVIPGATDHGLEGASGQCMGGELRLCALAVREREPSPYVELVDVG